MSRRNLQAGLEEIKEQYTQAVEKIKGECRQMAFVFSWRDSSSSCIAWERF